MVAAALRTLAGLDRRTYLRSTGPPTCRAETGDGWRWTMPAYLLQVAYTSDAWRAQVQNPHDVRDRVRSTMESLGARVEAAYYAFGEYDLIAIVEFPNNEAAAAYALAVQAGGAVKAFKTTPLMSIDEGMQAMRRAGQAGYRPPS
jgi:uncharacterized protein with GYD domain